MEKDFLKIGHRGAKGYIAENTINSFKKALELKVDAIELDIQVCKTGELVVFHDIRVDRITDGTGLISNLNFDYIRSLDAGNGSLIPTLEEVLDIIDNRVIVNIELKGEGSGFIVSNVIRNYIENRNWDKSNFLVSSFNHIELMEFKNHYYAIKIAPLLASIPINYATIAEDMGAHAINLSLEFVNQTFVDDAHKRGLKVFVYTANNIEDIKILKSMGVDGVFSDYPDRL